MRLFKPVMRRPIRGGEAVLRLATDRGLRGVTSKYFKIFDESEPAELAHDEALASELWDLSAELTGC